MMPHGTPTRYRYNGCRCDACRAAAAAQTLELRRRKRREAGPTEQQLAARLGLPGEEWQPIAEFDGYEVSNLGRLRSTKFTYPRILSTFRNRDGYMKVRLWRNNQPHYRYVHSLVAGAFISPRPTGMEVRHTNDDKLDNTASNLSYGTRSQNILDAVRNGKWHQSQKTHCPKGHPYDEANTYIKPSGSRVCRICQRAHQKASRAQRKIVA